MSISEYKRALLFRKAQGNVYRNEYFNKINAFTNESIAADKFISLEETDYIIKAIDNKEVTSRLKVRVNHYQELVNFIEEKTSGLSFYLLIDEEWKFCGAYRINDGICNSYDFDELRSDEIKIISYNLSFLIQIDYDSNEIECEFIMYK